MLIALDHTISCNILHFAHIDKGTPTATICLKKDKTTKGSSDFEFGRKLFINTYLRNFMVNWKYASTAYLQVIVTWLAKV